MTEAVVASAPTIATLATKPAAAAALPVARYVEYLTPAPYIEQIITEPFQLDSEGFLPIPTRPGLGIELNREALARFSQPR